MKKILLTGATGFIGSHIAERLLSEADKLSLYVRRTPRLVHSLEQRGARVHVGSQEDLKTLGKALEGVTTVVHCAGATRALDKDGYYETNVGFTRNILRLLSKGQRLVFISSQAAAGPSLPEAPRGENETPRPVSCYGKSKLAAETMIREWGQTQGGDYVILRPCTVYGPGDKDLFEYFRLIGRGLKFMPRNAERKISMIHVGDLVQALLCAMRHAPPRETYFVSDDHPYSWAQICHAIADALQKERTIPLPIPELVLEFAAVFSEAAARLTRKPALLNRQKVLDMKQTAWWCANQKLKRETGWRPALPLEKGIKETAEWYRQTGWL